MVAVAPCRSRWREKPPSLAEVPKLAKTPSQTKFSVPTCQGGRTTSAVEWYRPLLQPLPLRLLRLTPGIRRDLPVSRLITVISFMIGIRGRIVASTAAFGRHWSEVAKHVHEGISMPRYQCNLRGSHRKDSGLWSLVITAPKVLAGFALLFSISPRRLR